MIFTAYLNSNIKLQELEFLVNLNELDIFIEVLELR